MQLDRTTKRIMDNALAGKAPDRKECAYLLDLQPTSHDASVVRSTADWISRKRFDNQGILLGQIGIDASPCPGDCQFCTFRQSHTTHPPSNVSGRNSAAGQRIYTGK